MQNKGMGSQILEDLIAKAKQENLEIKLEVLKNNQAALRLYQRKGFVPDGENKTHLKLKLNQKK